MTSTTAIVEVEDARVGSCSSMAFATGQESKQMQLTEDVAPSYEITPQGVLAPADEDQPAYGSVGSADEELTAVFNLLDREGEVCLEAADLRMALLAAGVPQARLVKLF